MFIDTVCKLHKFLIHIYEYLIYDKPSDNIDIGDHTIYVIYLYI